jgi:hypothetical protein
MQNKGMQPDAIMDTFKESFKRKKQASGGIAGELHLNRPGYFLGNLVKLLRGGKNVYRGTSTGGGVGGHFVPEGKEFLKGKYYTADKKRAEMYAELGKGILGVKKITLSKKELEQAKRIGKKFYEEMILPKKLAKEAEIDIPSSIKVNVKKIIKDIREGNAEGGIAGELHLNRPGYAEQGFVKEDYKTSQELKEEADLEERNLLDVLSEKTRVGSDKYNIKLSPEAEISLLKSSSGGYDKKDKNITYGVDTTAKLGPIDISMDYTKFLDKYDVTQEGKTVEKDTRRDRQIAYMLGLDLDTLYAKIEGDRDFKNFYFTIRKSIGGPKKLNQGGLAKVLGV